MKNLGARKQKFTETQTLLLLQRRYYATDPPKASFDLSVSQKYSVMVLYLLSNRIWKQRFFDLKRLSTISLFRPSRICLDMIAQYQCSTRSRKPRKHCDEIASSDSLTFIQKRIFIIPRLGDEIGVGNRCESNTKHYFITAGFHLFVKHDQCMIYHPTSTFLHSFCDRYHRTIGQK